MSSNTVWAVVGSALGGIVAGVIGGIFIGKQIRQKRCEEEIDSVREAYHKYYKDAIKECAKAEETSNVPEEKAEEPKKASGRYPIEKSPYQVLTEAKAIEIAKNTDVDIEDFPVNDQGHHMYISDDVLTKKLGMEPSDIAEILNSSEEHIFVKNNIDGKLYEVYIPDPF